MEKICIGRDGDTYDHSLQLHYRQFLVALLFTDLPSLSPSFHEMIFILVYSEVLCGLCRVVYLVVNNQSKQSDTSKHTFTYWPLDGKV